MITVESSRSSSGLITNGSTGNHDVTLDSEFYAQQGQGFHGDHLEDPTQCLETVMRSAPSVIFLQHQAATIQLTRADGPNTVFKVFGSPYSQSPGNWAFGYETDDAAALWDQIPPDTDVLVTHTPPRSHCDQKPDRTLVGCNALREAMSRIRPPLAVCGHVHEGRGYERVRWSSALIGTGLDADGVERVTQGVLPPSGSKKQSLVDLTGKRGDRLDSDGFSCEQCCGASQTASISPASRLSAAGDMPDAVCRQTSLVAADTQGLARHPLQTFRRETCIVNAAIVANSWPHHGGKRFNSPIVVDLELPVRQGDNASPVISSASDLNPTL